jgi:UDPglucose 6-dehydrogenase
MGVNLEIGVVGLGKLGLPLLALLAESGHHVTGFDISTELVRKLKTQEFESNEPGLIKLLNQNRSNTYFTNDISELVKKSTLCCIIVPTPSGPDGSFKNDAILEVCSKIGQALKADPKNFIVNIVSTVMPGSCEGEIKFRHDRG